MAEWTFEDKHYIFIRQAKSVTCFLDRCSHQDVRLSEFGELRHDHIVCYAHGAEFSPETGQHLCPPATCGLVRFPVQTKNNTVWVDVNGGNTAS